MKQKITLTQLRKEAKEFADLESNHAEPSLFGINDGKTVGTYIEHKFREILIKKYDIEFSSSASGIDIPNLLIDIKVTSVRQPQSSCPFRSAGQKIFGLGYSLLIFVYGKTDDAKNNTSTLDILHTIFVEKERTADFQTTRGLNQILENDGNVEDLVGFMQDRNLPLDEIEAFRIAEELVEKGSVTEGYLTISNALQWRLQYSRIINEAGNVDGIWRVR